MPPFHLVDVEAAAARLSGIARRTPTIEWQDPPSLPGVRPGTRLLLKMEQLQRGGSFKLRGALNAMLSAQRADMAHGVYTASGGNHGIGVALAAQLIGVPATVYLPSTAPVRSEERLQRLGARTARAGNVWDEAYAAATEAAAAAQGLLIHPFNDIPVITGQATLALELVRDQPGIDLVIVGVGGGGLLAGTGVVLREHPYLQQPPMLVGVEPEGADSMCRSIEEGRPVRLDSVHTIAHTLAPLCVSERTLNLCYWSQAAVTRVSDDHIQEAQALLWEDLRLTVEPAGAAALAALLHGRVPGVLLARARTIAVILCGANL